MISKISHYTTAKQVSIQMAYTQASMFAYRLEGSGTKNLDEIAWREDRGTLGLSLLENNFGKYKISLK